MKTLLLFLFIPVLSFAANPDYDSNFESDGAGGSYSEHYDDTPPIKPVKPMDFYEDHTEGINIPEGVLDKADGKEQEDGQNLGSSVSGKVTTDEAMKNNVSSPLRENIEMETLGETFFCPVDNDTELFADKAECEKSCMTSCRQYSFNAQISCQTSEEVIKVSAVNPLAAGTPLRIEYRGKTYTTPPMTAVCGNGFLSGSTAYEWAVTKDSVEFMIPGSRETLGECRDMTGRAFMASFTDIYGYTGAALSAHLSRLGFIPSHTINGDMTMTVSIIVSGACNDNTLQTGFQNRDAIEKMAAGKLDESQAMAIAQTDENFRLITSGKNYTERSCVVRTEVNLVPENKTASGNGKGFLCSEDNIDVRLVRLSGNQYALDLLDYFEYPHQQCDWAADIDPPLTDDGWHRMALFEDGYALTDMNVRISGYLERCRGNYTFDLNDGLTLTGSLIDCPGYWPASEKTRAEITYSYSYKYTADVFSIYENDGCSSIPKDCKLMSESVCDMRGNNCVKIRDNGIPTGAKAPKSCNEVITATDKYSVCSDGKTITAVGTKNSFSGKGGYFTVKKEYSCISEAEEYDYSSFLEQNTIISESAVLNGDEYSFKGRGMGGSIDDFSTNISLTDPECYQTCKVKAPPSDNLSVVTSDGTVAEKPSFHTAYYKSCDKKDNGWICPLEPGETMAADCSCADDFTDTVIQLKFISESAGNMKCSGK